MKNFIKRIKERNKYSTNKRFVFYDLAGGYLPKNKDAVVVDIGSGYGFFADHLKLREKYNNLFLLDADPKVAEEIENSVLYKAPNELPFKNNSVDFIHCSHLVEHLNTDEFFMFLREMDRVLAENGVLVISAPLLNFRFYEGLAHIKPYGPEGIINYMCAGSEKNKKKVIAPADGGVVSNKYKIKDLVYRYTKDLDDFEWGSEYIFISVLIKIIRKTLSVLGFHKYTKNGYTLILKKHYG